MKDQMIKIMISIAIAGMITSSVGCGRGEVQKSDIQTVSEDIAEEQNITSDVITSQNTQTGSKTGHTTTTTTNAVTTIITTTPTMTSNVNEISTATLQTTSSTDLEGNDPQVQEPVITAVDNNMHHIDETKPNVDIPIITTAPIPETPVVTTVKTQDPVCEQLSIMELAGHPQVELRDRAYLYSSNTIDESKWICGINPNKTVEVIGQCTDYSSTGSPVWYKVKYNDYTGYMEARYLMGVDSAYESSKIAPIINDLRNNLGQASLSYSYDLEQAAMIRAKELTILIDHVRPNGDGGTSAINEYDPIAYYCGENLYYCSTISTAQEIFNSWKASDGHYHTMVGTDFTRCGIGVCYYNGGTYAVVLFAGDRK